MNKTELRLQAALNENHALAEATRRSSFPAEAFDALQQWQRERLAQTYADLMADDQFRAAGEFFLNELYGGLAFRERDQQVARVLPVMIRTLPEHMLHALARAFELQALSLELDMDMAHHMPADALQDLDAATYQRIYISTARREDRLRQIELIRDLGLELNELVRHRLVLNLVKLLRVPARAAGFGLLQDFLEQGLWAFRAMQDGPRFVTSVYQRELEIMQRLLDGQGAPFDLQKVQPKCSSR